MRKVIILTWFIATLGFLPIYLLVGADLSKAKVNTPASLANESSVEQSGPDWFDTAWMYRLPITITNNSGVELTDYQVLIKLDTSNFDFSKAKSDGSDVRFTSGNNIQPIDYWIEPGSWNKPGKPTYIWVEVPTLVIGDNALYLYYSNPSAGANSSGENTFIFYDDDWNQFVSGGGCSSGFPWECINPGAVVSDGTLVLIPNTGISTYSKFPSSAVGFRANYGLGAGVLSGGFGLGTNHRSVIRDLSSDYANLYLQNFAGGNIYNYLINRIGGVDWHNAPHVFEVARWVNTQNSENNQSKASIDHGTPVVSTDPTGVSSGDLSVAFNNPELSNATLLIEWVYVRKYTYIEPTVTAYGSEQGLVDLKMTMADSPDPLYAGDNLTYQLTVTNTSSINAPGVVLTDLLPVGVTLVSAVPSHGTCDSQVVCTLGTINGGSQAHVTLVVATTIDGSLINTASVESLGYDPIPSNNTAQETTNVLPSADLSIILHGYPQYVKPNDLLTYNLQITNQGPSTAAIPKVVMPLPEKVEYLSAIPGICAVIDGVITCSLNDQSPGIPTQILIIGRVQNTATTDIYATATVSSTTRDPVMTNNSSQVITLVDTEQPQVTWESPVHDEQTYYTGISMITLAASATDNYGIDRVTFTLWDHLWTNEQGEIVGRYVEVGTVTSEPYQVVFDSSELKRGEIYQMYVKGFDLAGNESIRRRILLEKTIYILFPIVTR